MSKRFPGVNEVLHLTTVDSTQTLAKTLAQQGAADATLVWADRQTKGRGQFRRKWISQAGGLYVSLIMRPRMEPDRLADLSLNCAGAVARALARLTGLTMAVKPPNDVYASNGSRRGKVCGLLIESSSRAKCVDWLIIGIGINVDNRPALATAASLKSLTRRSWGVERTLRAVLAEYFSTVAPTASKNI